MERETVKNEIQSAMTCLLSAAAATDAGHWDNVRAKLCETIERCNSVLRGIDKNEHDGEGSSGAGGADS
jgi:hypothetical protein